ncbi:DUF1707 SHOCT-like domain-containing protein [Kribbella deserti]|uniref:DUF1707 domain-containing protein n=1 Tax=Kribbella deserti TaxID=1926257 RepID=A0ABV6QTC2_9ACTN
MSQRHPAMSPSRVDSAPRRDSVRIGDAERDEAVTALSEHFVAGRLTQEEFEERSDQATRARYVGELSPLFDDLPEPAESTVAMAPRSPGSRPDQRRFRAGPPPFVMFAPILVVGLVVAAVVLSAPWLLWMFFWIALFSRPFGHRRWHHPHHSHRH